MSRAVRTPVAAVGLLILALVGGRALVAQVLDERPGRGTTLILLVRVSERLKQQDILDTINEGLDYTQRRLPPGCQCDPPRIRPIPPVVFDAFNTSQETASVTKDKAEKFEVRRVPELPSVWIVTHERGYDLKQLEVKVDRGKKKETLKFDTEFRSVKGDAPLSLLTPNTYALKLPVGDIPLEYKASLVSVKDPKNTRELTWTTFPGGDRFYMVVMRNFTGDREKLFNTIRRQAGDMRLVANPVTEIEEARELSLVFASWGFKGVRDGDVFQGNNYTCTINTPIQVDKVYIRFPLNEAEKKADLEKYNAMGSVELIKKIEEEMAAQKAEADAISPKSGRRWFELAAVPDGGGRKFSRSFPLTDFPGLSKKYPTASFLEVYRIGGAAVFFEKDGARLPANARDIDEWRLGLSRRVEAEKAGKKEK